MQARQLFGDERGFAFDRIDIVCFRVIGQRLLGVFDFGFQFARGAVEPLPCARELFNLSVEAGLDEPFGNRIGNAGGQGRIRVCKCDRHGARVHDRLDANGALQYLDIGC